MADIKIKKIDLLRVYDRNGIPVGGTGELVNFKAIENNRQPLSAERLTQTQSSLAIKINEIADLYGEGLIHLEEDKLNKDLSNLNFSTVGKPGDLLKIGDNGKIVVGDSNRYLKNDLSNADLGNSNSGRFLVSNGTGTGVDFLSRQDIIDQFGLEGVPWLEPFYSSVADFKARAKVNEMVKYNRDSNGGLVEGNFILLAKNSSSEVIEIRTWEQLKQYVSTGDLKILDDFDEINLEETPTGNFIVTDYLPITEIYKKLDLSAMKFDNYAAFIDKAVIVGADGHFAFVDQSTGGTGTNVEFGTLFDMYNYAQTPSGTRPVTKKVLDIFDIAEIFKDQQSINEKFLSEYSDDVYFKDQNNLEFRSEIYNAGTSSTDHGTLLSTVPITTTGNSISYADNKIKPLDRISQELASFTVTTGIDGEIISYNFHNADNPTDENSDFVFRFETTHKDDWYKFTKIGEYVQNEDERIEYIKIECSAGVTIKTSPDSSQVGVVGLQDRTSGYKVKLSDVLKGNENLPEYGTAKATVEFTALPPADTKIMTIDFVSGTEQLVNRVRKILYELRKGVSENVTSINSLKDLSGVGVDLTNADKYLKVGSNGKITFDDLANLGNKQYNLDDTTSRTEFMNEAKINNKYSFNIGGSYYDGVVVTGDKTSNFVWVGYGITDGPTGNKAPQFVTGSVSSQGHSEQSVPFVAEVYSPSIALPGAYGEAANLPKGAIKQMIIDFSNATVNDPADPTWRDISGTQTLQFNPSQIVITIDGANDIPQGTYFQFLLGSSAGNMVLDGAVQVFDDSATAALNGNVAGQYKWYCYKTSSSILKFVMEDSKSQLNNQAQKIEKVRNVSPDVQTFSAHYSSQAEILKGAVDIKTLAKGTSRIIDLPTGITTRNLTGISVTVGASTDWYTISGWDKVSPFYCSVTTEDTSNIWWVELKVEAVPGDDTKIKVTNFDSGNFGTQGANYNAHWIAFKGGR